MVSVQKRALRLIGPEKRETAPHVLLNRLRHHMYVTDRGVIFALEEAFEGLRSKEEVVLVAGKTKAV